MPTATLIGLAMNFVGAMNAALVVIPADQGPPTELVSLDLGYMEAGEPIRFDMVSVFDRGGAGGDILVTLSSEPRGAVSFSNGTSDLEVLRQFTSNPFEPREFYLSGPGYTKTSGNIVLKVKALSAGSDSVTQRGETKITVYR